MDEATFRLVLLIGAIVAGLLMLFELSRRSDPESFQRLEGFLLAILTIVIIVSVSIAFGMDWQTHARVLRNLVLFTWGVHLVNWAVFRGRMAQFFGIRPRQASGLIGVVCAPFLHNWQSGSDNSADIAKNHVFGNTWAFIVMGWLILLQVGVETFIFVTVAIALIGGLGTWLIGRPAPHSGASGVIYGYLGFLLVHGVLSGNPVSYLFALLVAIGYGSTVTSLLPGRTPEGVSWEGHLTGFLAGVAMAIIMIRQPEFLPTLFNERLRRFLLPDSMFIR
jgi:membrane associated rhomboid family serine protease